MNLSEKLSSRKFFIFNLVLVGAIFGFSLAFLSFSCSTPAKTAKAQESAVVIPQGDLAVAKSVQNAFAAVAEKVQPSVVEIKTVSIRKQQVPQFDGIPWEFFFGPQGGNNNKGGGQEREFRSSGLGSGIIVRQSGKIYYVLTNNHVVADANEISVAMSDGEEYQAEVVGKDERKDLAMVKFESDEPYPLATLGDSDKMRVGDWAIAIGNPLGYMSSFTVGVVSAVGRTGGPAGNINDFIQTDASINQGNSGGALVNIQGEVIGINTWIASNSGAGSIGLGFAIPINNVKRSIDEFINNKGQVTYGWLGISLMEADKDIAKDLGIEGKRGALAAMVFLESPAAKAGIQPGDYITAIDGKDMRGVQQVQLVVGDIQPGDKADFTILRDGKELNLTVRIEARDEKTAADNGKLWPGVIPMPITDSIRKQLKLDDSAQGVIAAQVVDRGPAAVVGLQRNDVITGINGEKVGNVADFYRVIREKTASQMWFDVRRGENNIETPKFKR